MGMVHLNVSADDVCDAMNEDGNFAAELWFALAQRLHMGLMSDDASDIAAGWSKEKVTFVANQFKALGVDMLDAHQMANPPMPKAAETEFRSEAPIDF